MSVVLRIFLKDLRRFWLFSALVIACAFFGAWFPSLGLTDHDGSAVKMMDDVRRLALALLLIFLVQDDPVVSDRAGWITRPIHAGALLAAKGWYILATIALPFGLITAAAAHHHGLALRPTLEVTGDVVLRLLFLAFLCGLIGSLGGSLLGAMLVVGIGAAIALLVVPYLPWVSGALLPYDLAYSAWQLSAAATILILGLLFLHYRLRRTRLTVGAVVAAAIVLIALVPALQQSGEPARQIPGLHLRVLDNHGFVGATTSRPVPLPDSLVIGLSVRVNSPPDHDYSVTPDRAEFVSATGARLAMKLSMGDRVDAGDGEPSPKIYTDWSNYPHLCLTVLGVRAPAAHASRYFPILKITAPDWPEWRGQRGQLVASFQVGDPIMRTRGSLPFLPGSALSIAGCRYEVRTVHGTLERGVDVAIAENRVYGPSAPRMWLIWALVNDHTGEVALEEYPNDSSTTYAQSYLVLLETEKHRFQHRWKGDNRRPENGLSAEWLAQARLVYVGLGRPAEAETTLRVPDFQLPTVGGGS